MMPRFTVERVRQKLGTRLPTADAAVLMLAELGIVTALTGQKKNRSFSYWSYIELLTRGRGETHCSQTQHRPD